MSKPAKPRTYRERVLRLVNTLSSLERAALDFAKSDRGYESLARQRLTEAALDFAAAAKTHGETP